MPDLVDRIAQIRNPFIYGLDIVGGMCALALRGLRRMMGGNVMGSVVVGAGVSAVGAGAVEAMGVFDPAVTASATSPQGAELVGVALGLSALGDVAQGMHQISEEGQEARERRRGDWLL